MNLSRLAVTALLLLSSAAAMAREDESSSASSVDAPVLDSPSITERPDDDATAPPTAESMMNDLAPILDQLTSQDGPADLAGKRAEQKWRVIPFGRVRAVWDDNVFISNTDPKADFSFTISPGIAVGWGDYSKEVRQLGEFTHYFEPESLQLDDAPQSFLFAKYAANGTVFIQNSGQDVIDHDALVAGRWETQKLTLGARLHFQTLSGADIDVGDRVKRRVGLGTITSSYQVSDKTSVELNLVGSSYDYDKGVDWSELAAESWLNYQILPKTRVSVGGKLGITDVKGGSTQDFEQALARLSYAASSKLAFSVDGGVEWRQYNTNVDDDLFTVFDVIGTYAPFDGTLINFTGYRRNSASVSLLNENITATGAGLRIQQRVLHRFYLGLEGTYQKAEYESILSQLLGGRKDDTVLIRPSVSFDITKHFSAESAYQFEHNESSLQATTFTENLISVQLNLQF